MDVSALSVSIDVDMSGFVNAMEEVAAMLIAVADAIIRCFPVYLIGPLTIQAARYICLNVYAEQRINYYAGIVIKDPSQAKFLKGWLNRVNTIVAMYSKAV